jgi:hypothetical protein
VFSIIRFFRFIALAVSRAGCILCRVTRRFVTYPKAHEPDRCGHVAGSGPATSGHSIENNRRAGYGLFVQESKGSRVGSDFVWPPSARLYGADLSGAEGSRDNLSYLEMVMRGEGQNRLRNFSAQLNQFARAMVVGDVLMMLQNGSSTLIRVIFLPVGESESALPQSFSLTTVGAHVLSISGAQRDLALNEGSSEVRADFPQSPSFALNAPEHQ